jgi:hypothetical protein
MKKSMSVLCCEMGPIDDLNKMTKVWWLTAMEMQFRPF